MCHSRRRRRVSGTSTPNASGSSRAASCRRKPSRRLAAKASSQSRRCRNRAAPSKPAQSSAKRTRSFQASPLPRSATGDGACGTHDGRWAGYRYLSWCLRVADWIATSWDPISPPGVTELLFGPANFRRVVLLLHENKGGSDQILKLKGGGDVDWSAAILREGSHHE